MGLGDGCIAGIGVGSMVVGAGVGVGPYEYDPNEYEYDPYELMSSVGVGWAEGLVTGSMVGEPVGNGVTTPVTMFVTLKALVPNSVARAFMKEVLLSTEVTLASKSAAEPPPSTYRNPSSRVKETVQVTALERERQVLRRTPRSVLLSLAISSPLERLVVVVLLPSPRRRRRLAELVMLKAIS